MTLSPAQKLLLRLVNRCPKGYALRRREEVTAAILFEAGLIQIIGIVAYPKEGG